MELAAAFVALLAPGLSAGDPAVQTRSLAPARLWRATLGVEERHVWTVPMAAGQRAEVEIAAAPPGLRVRLVDEAGREAMARDQAPGAATVSWVSTANGRWTIELTPLALPSPGPSEYAIWLPVLRQATARDQERWRRDLLAARLLRSLEEGDATTAGNVLPQLLAAMRSTEADDPAALAGSLEALGEHFAIFCDGATAADLLSQALALRESAQGAGHLEVARSLSRLASVRFFLGQWDLGEAAERRALDIRLRHFAIRPQAESYRDLGALYYSQGRFSEAIAAFERALELFARERPPSRADLAEVRGFLAEAHRQRGDRREAQAAIDRAVDSARNEQENAPQVYALVLANKAALHRDRGEHAEARSDLRQALRLLSGIDGYPSEIAAVTMNLADLDRAQKDYVAAEEGFRQALDLAEQVLCPGHPNLLYFLNQYALTLAEDGRHQAAETQYRRALEVAKAGFPPDHPMVAQSLYDLAETLPALARHAEAGSLSAQALTVRERLFGSEHPDVAASLVQSARLSLLRAHEVSEAALSGVERAIRILERTRLYPWYAIEAYAVQADLLRRRGDAAGARRALARALDLVDAQRLRAGGGDRTRAVFLRPYIGDFLRMVDWQLEAGDVETALAYTERYRARVLQDQLAASGMDLFGGGSRLAGLERRRAETLARIAELHGQLAFTRSRRDAQEDRRERILGYEASLEAVYRDFESVLEELKNENLRWRSVDGRPVSLGDIREIVPEQGLLLYYQIGDERSHLLLVPPIPDPPEAYPLEIPGDVAAILGVPPGPLTAAVAREIFPLRAAASPAGQSRLLHAAWKLLVPAGLWARLEPAAEVVVVPDRGLHSLPFEQLVVNLGDGSEAARYWLDDGPPLRYAPSASLLHTLGRSAGAEGDSAAPPVLTVSDPLYDPADLAIPADAAAPADPLRPARQETLRPEGERPLDRLPRTADETQAIVDVFRQVYGDEGADVLALMREQASEARVRSALPGKRFIHLGTHGIVQEERSELFASLALTPPATAPWSTENDGFLQLFEIYDLRLDAELVVLSACDSHVGRPIEGEGLFALSRGFHAAHARRVVASLWKVEEDSTAELMESFFRRVLGAYQQGRPIRYSEALRDAKREIRARPEWSSPFFWAPFVLTGIE